jgi:hypothetical protein
MMAPIVDGVCGIGCETDDLWLCRPVLEVGRRFTGVYRRQELDRMGSCVGRIAHVLSGALMRDSRSRTREPCWSRCGSTW